jgi:uncharacterized protein (DUF433 family)
MTPILTQYQKQEELGYSTKGKSVTLDRIMINSEVLSGKPVIKGTRIPVYLIVELLASGMTEKEILRQYPSLRIEDVKAALLYASKCVENADANNQLTV